jgi:hypothetical protein
VLSECHSSQFMPYCRPLQPPGRYRPQACRSRRACASLQGRGAAEIDQAAADELFAVSGMAIAKQPENDGLHERMALTEEFCEFRGISPYDLSFYKHCATCKRARKPSRGKKLVQSTDIFQVSRTSVAIDAAFVGRASRTFDKPTSPKITRRKR